MSTSLVMPLRSSSEHELERVFFIGSIAQSKEIVIAFEIGTIDIGSSRSTAEQY